MKAFWQLLAICFLVASSTQISRAQVLLDTVDPLTNNVPSVGGAPFSTAFSPGSWLPGRMWMEVTAADNGLGYQGSFGTIGGKTRLFQDSFDGRDQRRRAVLGELQEDRASLHGGLSVGAGFRGR